MLIGWRLVLRLQLGPRPSDNHVLGWATLSATPQEVVLGVRSPILGTAHLLLRLDRAHITLATFIRFERPGARVLWSIVGLVHRQTLPRLLERAAHAGEPGSPARN